MQNHINIEGEDSVKNAKNKDQNHSSTSNNLFNMLNRISGNKTQFWKPTTIKVIRSTNLITKIRHLEQSNLSKLRIRHHHRHPL